MLSFKDLTVSTEFPGVRRPFYLYMLGSVARISRDVDLHQLPDVLQRARYESRRTLNQYLPHPETDHKELFPWSTDATPSAVLHCPPCLASVNQGPNRAETQQIILQPQISERQVLRQVPAHWGSQGHYWRAPTAFPRERHGGSARWKSPRRDSCKQAMVSTAPATAE
jgi:hypothetical protein